MRVSGQMSSKLVKLSQPELLTDGPLIKEAHGQMQQRKTIGRLIGASDTFIILTTLTLCFFWGGGC